MHFGRGEGAEPGPKGPSDPPHGFPVRRLREQLMQLVGQPALYLADPLTGDPEPTTEIIQRPPLAG